MLQVGAENMKVFWLYYSAAGVIGNSVVVAKDIEQAHECLRCELGNLIREGECWEGLKFDDVVEIDPTVPNVYEGAEVWE